MGRIEETFSKLRSRGEKALVGFITAGDPDFSASLEITRQMCRSGVDLLELGVPFSDPTADGPVIQRSSARAIGAGMSMKRAIEMVGRVRAFSSIPIHPAEPFGMSMGTVKGDRRCQPFSFSVS